MEKYKVLLSVGALDDAFSAMYKKLKEVAEVEICGLDGFSLGGVDIFIGKKLGADKLKGADNLKAVFAYKTGVDDFPLKALSARGVALYNSHVNSRYIAEYAFGLSAALVNRIAEFDRRMRKGDWCVNDYYWKSFFSMNVGLVGFGSIGRAINDLLTLNGIATYTIDRGKNYENITAVGSLEELCNVCDLLILSLPKTTETDKFIDGRILKLLSGKYIVNVGRSNSIDESALYEALESRTLAGAAIDTWRAKATSTQAFYPFDKPFNKLENVILSSHKAMQVSDGHAKYVDDTLENVLRYINGESPRNAVDLSKGY